MTPMVTVNGGEVWRAPYELHRRALLDSKLVEQMHALAVETGSWYWAYAVDRLFNYENWTDDIAKGLDYVQCQWTGILCGR